MPTLRPQNLSGLVVIPTVELDSGIYRVSIGVNVGQSRTPPAQVVSREDLVVELRNPAEGSFEPIGSPDPGPLPVRALRVVQARGEFTFSQGNTTPDELVVALRGDRKSFPMSQTLPPTKCLGRELEEGDPFRGSKPGRPSLRGFPWPFQRTQCCVRDFDAPQNSATDATVKSEYFEVDAAFGATGRKCACGCCEYRQYVRGTFSDAGGAPVRFDLPSGALRPGDFCEDGSIDEFGSGKHGFYGHRSTSSPGDEYNGAGGKAKGCTYRGRETAGCPPTEGVELEFLGLLIDTCRGTVVAKRKWSVQL